MTVIRIIHVANHSSSQIQARCYIDQQFHYKALHGKVPINYVDKINRILGGTNFGPIVYIVNKHGRDPLAEATYQISVL